MTRLPSPARAPRAYRGIGVPYSFLAPALILFAAFLAAPICYTGYLSLRRVTVTGLGLGPGSRVERWAGLGNYTRALSDPQFLPGLGRAGGYGLLVVPIMLGLALIMALLLDSGRTRVASFARTSIFLPYAVPAVVASLLWGFLYLPRVSPIADALGGVGLPVPEVLGGSGVLYAVANIAVWGGTGFNMIVIYTALRSIPGHVIEAARIDGAGDLRIALRIKIPIVLPSLVMTFVFSLIATLQVFAEPMTLRPLTNTISATWMPLMKVYRDAFTRNDLYSAAATSIVLALVTFALSFGFLKLVGSRAFAQEDGS